MDAVWSLQSAVHPRVHRASDERIMSVAGAESRETDQCNSSELVTAHTPVTSECTTCTLTGVRRARLPAQLHACMGRAVPRPRSPSRTPGPSSKRKEGRSFGCASCCVRNTDAIWSQASQHDCPSVHRVRGRASSPCGNDAARHSELGESADHRRRDSNGSRRVVHKSQRSEPQAPIQFQLGCMRRQRLAPGAASQ